LFADGEAESRLATIRQEAKEGRIVAVGECGVDRNAPVAMDWQMDLFQRQAEIAAEYGLPLIVHGVRAIPEIIGVHNRCRASGKWVLHGFNNRQEILTDVLQHGFYISAGRHVLNAESNIYRLLPEIPDDRLFLETDNSDMAIEDIYRAVAERKGVSVEELQRMVRANFERVFPV
ncbi:MAG: TatD family hydrolase, partial [Odoribacter sp.]|nr:TatD family hydrolase [Odoribacter sp.]